ncbi:alkaline shock response membrane anchor protein AmaP [Candidatus Aerophobetes bacterium]|uniref:Alkaline shock response membrane anchor protein AmaP n=1 Tax=Aerophobetes bacterium TaxID=2030807 RepID=A0A523S4F6_UNCAE|nr:MAG: alkaline shock response membrane anchor protein AmaP [Candidatus Aerophobetes bacterium]
MGFCKKVLWGIVVVTLALFSLGGFLVSLEIIPRIVIMGALTGLEEQLLIKGIFVSFFGFLFVLSIALFLSARERAGDAIIPLKNPLGEVEISQKAICEFIQRVGKEVEGVEDIKARIKSNDEGMDVYLALSAQAQGEIPRLIDELQTVVKNYLNNTVGIENIREIKVKVAKIL